MLWIFLYALMLLYNFLSNSLTGPYCGPDGALTGLCERGPVMELLSLFMDYLYLTLMPLALVWVIVLFLKYVIKMKNHGA